MRSDPFSISANNEAGFLVEGEEYYERFLQMIKGARHTIHLQTYIFEMDLFGTQVKNELLAAASRGVRVFLLVDAVGSKNFESTTLQAFQKAGLNFCRFNEIHSRRRIGNWGRRLHHKVLLADDAAIVGGINVISSAYGVQGAVPQLDFAICISGGAIKELFTYCERTFSRASGHNVFSNNIPVQTPPKVGIKLKISINDWTLWRNHIARRYSNFVQNAEKNIVIINSYFFPRKKFMKQLAAAARRGVRVRIILPSFSDWPISVLASQYLYSYFLKHHVEIYQWKKSILHGKMATVDNSATTVGSFNLNYTAYQQNLEMNVDILSLPFTQTVNARIENLILDSCERITVNHIENASVKVRVLRFFSYVIMSLVANFSVALSTRGIKPDTN